MLNVVKHLRREASQGYWYQTLRPDKSGLRVTTKKPKEAQPARGKSTACRKIKWHFAPNAMVSSSRG